MSGTDDTASWREARRWFAIADQDVRAARLCLDAHPPLLGAAAYHCQQAAEKLIKGLLIAAGVPFRKVHDLDELAETAATRYPGLVQHLDPLRPLTRWGTAFRYPGLGEDDAGPSEAEIGATIDLIEALRGAIPALDPQTP